MSATGDMLQTQQECAQMCRVFSEFLSQYAHLTNGYMFIAAFNVTFMEMKRIIAEAQGSDKILIEQLVKSIIGSFGSTIQ